MRRTITFAAAAVLAIALLVPTASAKGRLRVILSGGDLEAPITLDGPLDGRDMYGDGVAMSAPLPFPEHIFTIEAYPVGAAEGMPETIYYYPAHDGLPSAFRTRYGFFAVTEELEAVLRGHLEASDDRCGVSPRWLLIPGLAAGLASAGGVALFRGRRHAGIAAS